jgi:DNA-binding CsgD family transcriptional regulator
MGSIRELESGNEFQQKTKQRLKSELELKDRELVSILLQLSQKNEIISTIDNLSNSGQKAGSSKQILEKINKIAQTKNLQKLDWSIIETQIEKLHPGFFNHLLVKHPLLTNNEKKLCCYLRLGLSSKDISGLQNISAKSVEISRVRLRKKLKINSKLRLTNYLSQI